MNEKTLPSLRITSKLAEHMKLALDKYNSKKIIKIKSQQEFRRFALEYFAQKILQDKDLDLLPL